MTPLDVTRVNRTILWEWFSPAFLFFFVVARRVFLCIRGIISYFNVLFLQGRRLRCGRPWRGDRPARFARRAPSHRFHGRKVTAVTYDDRIYFWFRRDQVEFRRDGLSYHARLVHSRIYWCLNTSPMLRNVFCVCRCSREMVYARTGSRVMWLCCFNGRMPPPPPTLSFCSLCNDIICASKRLQDPQSKLTCTVMNTIVVPVWRSASYQRWVFSHRWKKITTLLLVSCA